MKLVEVEWTDASSTDIDWTEYDDLECCTFNMFSVGYLLKYTSETCSLVQNHSAAEGNRVYSHVINIPVSCIQHIHILKRDITTNTYELSSTPIST